MSLQTIISQMVKNTAPIVVSPTSYNPLFIMTGESNTGGIAPNGDLLSWETSPRSSISILNNSSLLFQDLAIGTNNLIQHYGLTDNTTHSWENGFAYSIERGYISKRQIKLVKAGQGGSKIADWDVGATSYLGQNLWQIFQNRYNAAMAIDPTFTPYIFYQQGINDSIAGTNITTWKTKTLAHWDKIRALVGANTPIFVAKFMTAYATYNTAIDEIVAQRSYIYTIDSDSETLLGDGNHYTTTGQKNIAFKFINKLREKYPIFHPYKPALTNSIIVCDGNSLTAGQGSSNVLTKSYPAVLASLAPFSTNGTVIYNKGVSAQTTLQMTADGTTDIDPLYNNRFTSIVIAWEGGNDIYFNGNATTAYTNYVAYMEARRAKGFRTVAFTCTPRNQTTSFGDNPTNYNIKLNTFNNLVRTNWPSFADFLVDPAVDSRLQGYSPTYYNVDGVHFTDAG